MVKELRGIKVFRDLRLSVQYCALQFCMLGLSGFVVPDHR